MKKPLIYILLLLTLPTGLFAQVTVSGSTGADATYPTLALAFTAINGTAQTGNNIDILITSSTTEPTSAVLNAGTWTSIIIHPAGTGLSISGNLAAPLIDLNGADNATIDGSVNGTKDLIIENTSTSNTAGTSTIQFRNDATGNNIKNCILKGSETASASGILFFSTTTGTTGNDGNTIDNNDITSSVSAGRPLNTVYSLGTAALENSGNIVSNNNIYDFLNRGAASNGIYIGSNNSDWTISGNSFYETSSLIPSASVTYYVIRINNTGGNYNISGNFIGGSAPSCGGTALTKTNSFNNAFYGIHFYAGTGTENSIQDNNIKNIDWSNSLNAAWVGIYIIRGNANVGTISGNTIGAISGTGSILLSSQTSGNNVVGINILTPGTVNCQNNKIGSVNVANNDASGCNFYGIYKAYSAGTTTISNNLIGSEETPNSILASSASTGYAQAVRGIYNAGTGEITISSNTIANLTNSTTNITLTTLGKINGIFSSSGINTISENKIYNLTIANANNQSDLNASVIGIVLNGPTPKNIIGNTIYNLYNTYPDFRGSVTGLYYVGSTGANSIERNFIHSLSVNSSTNVTNIFGIRINSGAGTYYNNVISLGGNTPARIFGIYETGAASNNNKLFFNTVYISGNPVSVSTPSYALYSVSGNNTRDFRNNILVNSRSTTGGTNLHYAIYINSTAGLLTCDFNDYRVTGAGGILGYFGGTKTTLPIVTGQDAASLSVDPLFALADGTNAPDYIPSAPTLLASPGTGITADYAGNLRDSDYPTIGAFETARSFNVEVYKAAVLQASYIRLKDAFDAFNDGTHNTGSFEIKITGDVNETSSAVLNASGTGSANYTSVQIYPTIAGITISGNLAAPLIDLNGADNVTIDGRVNATGAPNALTISNTSIADTSITSTIRMINSSTDNAVRYCTLKGSAPGTGSGVLLFSTSTGTSGNNGTLFEFNDITASDDANRPLNAIYSGGTAAFLNSGDTIRNNNIYDFLNPGLGSSGIYAGTNSTDWTISGNSFYETSSFIPSASVTYYIVRLNNTGGNYSVSGNFIGGSAPACGGTPWTKTNAFNNAFYGIYLSAGTGTSNNIQNNIIRNIDWSNSLNAAWTGIYTGRGDVNIGTVAANILGAETGTGSILLTSKTTGNNVYGINIASPGTVSCLNNKIGAITIANADANGSNFYGINKTSSAGITNISNNTIGSTSTPGSINATSPSTGNAQAIRGIYNAGTGAVTISNNTIANLTNGTTNTNGVTPGKINGIFSSSGTNTISGNSIHDLTIANANNQTNLNASVCGISLSGPTLKNVTGNTIYNLSNNYASFTGSIIGLYFTGSTGGNSVILNYIHDLKVTSSSAFIYGIKINTGSSTLTNNIITLGGNSATTLYGIYETGTAGFTDSLNFNTVYIAGSPASGTNKSYALYSAVTTNNRIFINNIFANARSTSGGSNLHYAAYIVSSGGSITCNYNNYWVSGTGGILGYYGANKSTLPIVTGQDGLSLAINPTFTGSAGAPEDYMTGVELPGLDGTAVRTDFGGNPRIVPTMGAWEGFIAKWKGAVSDDWNTAANWTSGIVPAPEANILFDPVPLNNLVMDQDRSVRKITDSTAYIIVTNGHKLTLKGQLFFSSGSKLDASAINSTLEIISDSIHTIDNIQFLNSRTYNLIIGNTTGVSLNSDFTVDNSMTINAGTRLYINAPNQLTVSGAITNNAGVNGLIIKSTGNGIDAKLINNSPSVNASVELLLSGGTSPTGRRIHSFVPPVQFMTVGADIPAVRTSLDVTYFDGYLLYWDETKTVTSQSQGWQYFDGYNNTTPLPSGAITSGMGYYFYLTQDDTVTFKGSLNGSTHTFNLKYTPGNKDPGGNLIGNPYPCNYDLTGVPEFMGPASDNVDNTVYFYSNGQYKVYNVSTGVGDIGYNNIVPPMQGFFVNITGPKSLSFPATSKTSAAAGVPRSKGAADSEKSQIRKIKMILKNDLSYDEAYICLIDKATSGFDGDYDGYKMFGSNNTTPLIYSDFNSVKYAINSIQEPDSGAVIIPLTVELTTGGTYKINFPEFENLDGIKVVLKHGTQETRISKGTTYSFTSAAGKFSNFEIIIGDYTKSTLSEIPVRSQFNTWYNDGYLYIKCSVEVQTDKGKLIIYDSQGKVVLNNNLINISPGNTIQLPVNLTRGLYIINVVVGNKPSTSKIVVF